MTRPLDPVEGYLIAGGLVTLGGGRLALFALSRGARQSDARR